MHTDTYTYTHTHTHTYVYRVMAAELRITEPELKGPSKMKRLGQLWQSLSEDEHKKWAKQVKKKIETNKSMNKFCRASLRTSTRNGRSR